MFVLYNMSIRRFVEEELDLDQGNISHISNQPIIGNRGKTLPRITPKVSGMKVKYRNISNIYKYLIN